MAEKTNIDRALNLVVPIEREDGTTIWAHSTPLPYAVFSNYAVLCGQLMNALFTRGLGLYAPRYAREMLRTIVQENGPEDSELSQKFKEGRLSELDKGLMAEIHRLTILRVPNDNGWEPMPLTVAKQRSLISQEEADRLDSALLFFSAAWRSGLKQERPAVEGALKMWNAAITSQDFTEFATSLRTLTAAGSSGATQTA